MKKMMMILMMVLITMGAAVFADSYVAFTSKEEFEKYCNSDHSEWDAKQKAFFEETTADLSNKQKKKAKLILVCGGDTEVIKNHILIYNYIYDPKSYGVIVFDDNFNVIVNSDVYVNENVDPVLVGLIFIKDKVTHIVSIDNQKVVFGSYDKLK